MLFEILLGPCGYINGSQMPKSFVYYGFHAFESTQYLQHVLTSTVRSGAAGAKFNKGLTIIIYWRANHGRP